jgi:putative membrane protein
MDILFNILFWIHLVSLGLAGAAVFGLPVVGSKMATATADSRPLLISIQQSLSTMGRAALGTLVLTGLLMFWLRWQFVAPSALWFGIKMLLVVLLLANVIFAGITSNKARQGDRAAAQLIPRLSVISIALYLAVVFSAVFAFN